jgi:hypothetical protein
MEDQQAPDLELEDILFLEILKERDIGNTMTYEEFCKEMAMNDQES